MKLGSRRFIPEVQTRGAAVIKARGASSAASAANGVSIPFTHYTNRSRRYIQHVPAFRR